MSKSHEPVYGKGHLHFITCSCYHRQAWLASPQRRDLFLAVFEEVRQRSSGRERAAERILPQKLLHRVGRIAVIANQ